MGDTSVWGEGAVGAVGVSWKRRRDEGLGGLASMLLVLALVDSDMSIGWRGDAMDGGDSSAVVRCIFVQGLRVGCCMQ